MTTEMTSTEQEGFRRMGHHGYRGGGSGGGGAVYGLGLIGAWIYYISHATTFEEGVIGFLKGLVWPAFMVYEILQFLEKEHPASQPPE